MGDNKQPNTEENCNKINETELSEVKADICQDPKDLDENINCANGECEQDKVTPPTVELLKLKRPLNPFMQFANKNRATYQQNYPKLNHQQLTKAMAKDWKNLPDLARKPYCDQYTKDMSEMKKLNPQWSGQYTAKNKSILAQAEEMSSIEVRKQRLRPEPPKLLPFEPVDTPKKKRRKRNHKLANNVQPTLDVKTDNVPSKSSYECPLKNLEVPTQSSSYASAAFKNIFDNADTETRQSILKEMSWGIFEYF